MALAGRWSDGRTAAVVPVTLQLDARDYVQVQGLAAPRDPCPLARVSISPPLGSTPRYLRFPDGAQCETLDHAEVARWEARQQQRGERGWSDRLESVVHRLEQHWLAVLVSLLLLVGFGGWFAVAGAPLLAEAVALRLPPAMVQAVGRDSLTVLDKAAFSPSQLAPERQQALTQRFQALLPADTGGLHYALVFRQGSRTGPNAFALPDGTVVLTDELVGLAAHDGQVAAVLLHEIGHVHHRHLLRQLIQHSALAALLVGITGDIQGASEMVLALPSVLMQAHYSQAMETEADTYALERMPAHGLPPQDFADILRRLEAWEPPAASPEPPASPEPAAPPAGTPPPTGEGEVEGEGMGRYLASHPETAERIRRFEAAEALRKQ